MAKATISAPMAHRYLYLRLLFAAYFLLSYYTVGAFAQSPSDENPSLPGASPTDVVIPTLIDNPASSGAISRISTAAATFSPTRTSTDSADYASHSNHTDAEDGHVLNYYFLLLAIFVIVLALVYWTLARRRHQRLQASRSVQQNALAQDLQIWPGRRRGLGRWRAAPDNNRTEEGLDERGEAPPPYLKEPEQAHPHDNGDEGVELRDMSRPQGKPPAYGEATSRS